jgi:hypothetical protein
MVASVTRIPNAETVRKIRCICMQYKVLLKSLAAHAPFGYCSSSLCGCSVPRRSHSATSPTHSRSGYPKRCVAGAPISHEERQWKNFCCPYHHCGFRCRFFILHCRERFTAVKLINDTHDMTPCNIVEIYQGIGGTCCLHLQGRFSE